jgi:hypothetical protein
VAKRESDPGFAPDWCVHFRSMAQHQTCKEGIDYTALNGGSEYHRMHRLPCFIKNSDKPKQRVGCQHFTAPSVEEIALHRQWDEDRQNRLTTALMGISPWRVRNLGRSHAEIVKCPVCRGDLHLSITAFKGHVRGRCATGGCVSWAE